ncbi:hypothetical protein FQN57_007405 [Myotisia sp. PD_48]|nr:hypothetical protein FQN57_007405 [Myotisia sp. PD_48]
MATKPPSDPPIAKSPQRLPPPFLFQGPSSRNASNLSLPSGAHSPPGNNTLLRYDSSSAAPPLADIPGVNTPITRQPSHGHILANEADALWDQIQNTLADVELTAMGGDQMFGTHHSDKVETLRAKQLALAQAWARSEAEEVAEQQFPSSSSDGGAIGGDENNPHEILDEKTEKDILQARKRRLANDRYFERVNKSVLDVVAKLEDVAQVMQDVANKNKELWGVGESVQSTDATSNG